MPDRIRVLFAIGSMAGGGSERQLLGILHHLDRSRFVPLLYLVDRTGELLDEVPDDVSTFAFWDRHRYPRWNFPGRIHRMQARDMAGVIREENVDVVYERTYLMTLIAAAAARRAGVPRVSAVVCDPKQDMEQTAGRFVGIKRHLLRQAYLRAHCVTAVSEGVRTATIEHYRLPPQQVVTVYNSLDIERIGRLANGAAPEWEPGRFHIVAAGRLQEQKGYSYLLQAIDALVHHRNHTQVLLHLLGRGPLETELTSYVKSRQLEAHVCLHGFVENPFPLFRGADLFCLPSLFEGMPNSLIEAMACGVPVLSTDCRSGPREILADGKYGRLVPPGDAKALADAVEDAIRHYDQWREKVTAARDHVERTFSPAVGIARIEERLISACRT